MDGSQWCRRWEDYLCVVSNSQNIVATRPRDWKFGKNKFSVTFKRFYKSNRAGSLAAHQLAFHSSIFKHVCGPHLARIQCTYSIPCVLILDSMFGACQVQDMLNLFNYLIDLYASMQVVYAIANIFALQLSCLWYIDIWACMHIYAYMPMVSTHVHQRTRTYRTAGQPEILSLF